MTEKRILVSTDNNAINEFKRSVTATAEAASSLIELYHTFQPWKRIRTVEDFISLASDPADFFDSTLLDNVEIKAAGVTPDPGRLAELIGIHRSSFLNLCSGLNIPDEDNCPPCGKVRIKRGQRAISLSEFNRYRDYLTFTTAGIFTVNTEAVDNSLDKFSTYATTSEEIERYALFNDLVQMLNRWDAVYPLSGSDKLEVKKIFGLHLSRGGEGDFMINPITLTKAVQSIKYQ